MNLKGIGHKNPKVTGKIRRKSLDMYSDKLQENREDCKKFPQLVYTYAGKLRSEILTLNGLQRFMSDLGYEIDDIIWKKKENNICHNCGCSTIKTYDGYWCKMCKTES